jgi:hypothetical protein
MLAIRELGLDPFPARDTRSAKNDGIRGIRDFTLTTRTFRVSLKVIGISSDPTHYILLLCKKGQKQTPFIDNSIFPLYYIHTFTGVSMSSVKPKLIYKKEHPPEADALADSHFKAYRPALILTDELIKAASELGSDWQGEWVPAYPV